MKIKLGLLGFGNVLRQFVELLLERQDQIQQQYGITFSLVGISTNSHGIAIDPDGLDLRAVLEVDNLDKLHQGAPVQDTLAFIAACPADVMLEATWMDPKTGQPALDYIRAALNRGMHVVTANKGPVVFGYHELKNLAASKNLGFFYESTVMDGMPLHSLRREGLLAAKVTRIRGVLNSTTNFILTRLEEGKSFEEAVKGAQEYGVAETNPSNDIDGWDASIKIAILANIFMGADLRPVDVDRTGIRELDGETVRLARQNGTPYKLVCEAVRESQQIKASVKPVQLPADDPLASLRNTASAITIETDILERVTMIEGEAGPRTTAYGMLVDTINIIRGRRES